MEFSHGYVFVFGSEPGLCCISMNRHYCLSPLFAFCKMGTRKPCTGRCVAALVCAPRGSHGSITCVGVFCVLRAVSPTDPLSAPEDSGQVTFGGCVTVSLLLPDT